MMLVDEQQKGFLMKRFENLDTEGVQEKLDYITFLFGWQLAVQTLVSVITLLAEQKKVTEVDIENILKGIFENTLSESSGYSHFLEHISTCPETNNFDDVLNWVQKSKIGHSTRSTPLEKQRISPRPKTAPKSKRKESIKALQDLVAKDKFEDITNFVTTHIGEFGWNETKEVLLSSIKNRSWHQQHELVQYVFDLEFLEGIDVPATELLAFESANVTYDAVRDDLLNHASNLLDTQLKNNGSTLFFDVDVLIKTGFARHVPEIINLRNSQFLWAYNRYMGSVNPGLENLLLTHYGNMLLGSLKQIPPRNDLINLLKKIVRQMKGKSVNNPVLQITMSHEFKNRAFISASRGVKDELGYDIRRIEFGFSHLPSAFNVLVGNLDEYNLYIGNKDTFALREQAIQILESDKSEESTEYLLDALESLDISTNEHDRIYTYPFSSETWGRVIQALLTRNCENRVVRKLESVLKDMYEYYYPYGSEVYPIAAKYLAEIKGASAYSTLWSQVVKDRYNDIWICWEILDVILSIGPSIEAQLSHDIFEEMKEQYLDVDTFLALIDYLDKLGVSSWPTEEIAWRFDDPKISRGWIEYFARHNRTRALQELCTLFGIDDNGIKDFEYVSTFLQSLNIGLTEDEIVTFVSNVSYEYSLVTRGALICLVVLQTAKGDHLLENLLAFKNRRDNTLMVLAEFGNEAQVFRAIEFLVNSSQESVEEIFKTIDLPWMIGRRLSELGSDSKSKLEHLHDTATGTERSIYSLILEELSNHQNKKM